MENEALPAALADLWDKELKRDREQEAFHRGRAAGFRRIGQQAAAQFEDDTAAVYATTADAFEELIRSAAEEL